MGQQKSKLNLLDHSAAKISLLKKYLDRYLNIISNDGYTEKILIYDLFCGEGIYENGGEGSPVIIMRSVKDLHFINVARSRKIPQIECHFNDFDSVKVNKLKIAIAKKHLFYPEFGKAVFTSHDFQSEVIKLSRKLEQLRKQKAFIFIDPYEYRHIKANDIKIY